MDAEHAAATLNEAEQEIITLIVGAVQTLGLPKSLGEIYGLLYLSPEPLSMDDIMKRLRISLGSASQGLKQLRTFHAVRVVYKPGQRRDYYEPETELRKLLANILSEQLQPRLDAGHERLQRLRQRLSEQSDGPRHDHLRQRVDKLSRWHDNASQLVPLLSTLIRV